MKHKPIHTILFACALTILWASTASAHFPSLTVDNYHPNPGDMVTVNIGWGHKFPGDGLMKREAYDHTALEVIGPDGVSSSLALAPNPDKGNMPVTFTIDKPGMYTIRLVKKNFSTKTAKGYKYQPKNELTQVIHGKWSETVSQAVLYAGDKTIKAPVANGDKANRLEMVLLEPPLGKTKGDMIGMQVTLDGNPFRGMVYATYEGFSDKADTFGFATKTDKNGVAFIKILEKGLWLIKTGHTYPYEDKNKADDYDLMATMTLNIL